ncbi:TPA: hypothetical protein ACHILZ_003072 [Enterococcus faecium]
MSDYLTAEQYEYARKTGDWESGKVLTHGQALNNNQKIVLEYLKSKITESSVNPINAIVILGHLWEFRRFNRIRQKSPILYRWVMNAVRYEGYRW